MLSPSLSKKKPKFPNLVGDKKAYRFYCFLVFGGFLYAVHSVGYTRVELYSPVHKPQSLSCFVTSYVVLFVIISIAITKGVH